MKLILVLIFLIIVNFTIVSCNESDDQKSTNENKNEFNEALKDDDKSKTLPRKMLTRRREEHLQLLKGIALNPKYEWRYQLVEIGVKKVLELIHENRKKEEEVGADDSKLTECKMLILENACLLMDFLVNFNYNGDIYKIVKSIAKKDNFEWKESVKFSIDYLDKNNDMLDMLTSNELSFLQDNLDTLLNEKVLPEYPYENNIKRDINIAERIYTNEKQINEELKSKKDKKKKGKRGPSLQLPPLRSQKTEL